MLAPETTALLQVAERHGQLAATLEEIADDYANLEQERSALRAALSWPIVLGIGLSLLLSLTMIFVIPAFAMYLKLLVQIYRF